MTGAAKFLGVLAAVEFMLAGIIVARASTPVDTSSPVVVVAIEFPSKGLDRLRPPGWTTPAPLWRTREVSL